VPHCTLRPSPASVLILKRTLEKLLRDRDDFISALKRDKRFKAADWIQIRKMMPTYRKLREEAKSVEEPEVMEFNTPARHRKILIVQEAQKNLVMTELNKRLLMVIKSSYLRQVSECVCRNIADHYFSLVQARFDVSCSH
jgi:hypothetical protein